MSSEGVTADPAKIEKVVNWPVPSSKGEVQQFLGLVSYYRQFIRDCTHIAKPLYQLTECSLFAWTAECGEAFSTLKKHLSTPSVLVFPDFAREFVLDTDASNQGIGAVLSQIQSDGQEQVVVYASRLLSKTEQCYSEIVGRGGIFESFLTISVRKEVHFAYRSWVACVVA